MRERRQKNAGSAAPRARRGLERLAGQPQRSFGGRGADDAGRHDFAPASVDHAEHERFLDEASREQGLLDAGRIHLLAAGDDHAVGPTGNLDAPVCGDVAPIAAHPWAIERAVGP